YDFGGRTTLLAQRSVTADEERFGAADRGHIEEQPAVTGQAEAPGVGDAVAVEDDGIGTPPEPLPGRCEGRELAEGEKSRDVREVDVHDGGRLLERLVRLDIDGHDSGVSTITLPADRQVGTRDEAGIEAGRRLEDESLAQSALERA